MVPVHDICGCATDCSAPLTEPSRVETAARTETMTGQVTFLIYSPFPKYSGGRENWLHNLAPHLIKRGHPVRVVSYASDRRPFYSTSQSGIESVVLRKVLANGQDTKDRLAGAGIASTVVPNGVDFERFARPAAGDSIGDELGRRAGGRPVVAFVATMQAIKGAGDAIEVAAELRKLETDFVLAMVGKGDP